MDILEPFPVTAAPNKFLLVAINYYTKWTKEEAWARIIEAKIHDCLEVHYLSIQLVSSHRYKQRASIRQCKIYEILQEAWNAHHLTSIKHPQTTITLK